jgi:formylglycine-generating enzyme required for sulfatase activity
MIEVAPAEFYMGALPQSEGYHADEVIHPVTITRGFSIGVSEVTQGLWTEVMGSNPSEFQACGAECPVESVTWCDAVTFANALSTREGLRLAYTGAEACEVTKGVSVSWDRAADGYRLPTEAEWELAARAGGSTRFAGGEDADAVAWHKGNSDEQPHPVCTKAPNAWGLCDMSGNLWEWTWDWNGATTTSAVVDPSGELTGKYKVARGGSWRFEPLDVQLTRRYSFGYKASFSGLGFRLARSTP